MWAVPLFAFVALALLTLVASGSMPPDEALELVSTSPPETGLLRAVERTRERGAHAVPPPQLLRLPTGGRS